MTKYLLAAILALAPAQGAIIFYNDQSLFQTALSSSYLEDFEGLPDGIIATPNFTDGTYGYTVSAPGGVGSLQVLGDRVIGLGVSGDVMTINTFLGSPNAFGGFFFFDDGNGTALDLTGAGTITVSNGVDPDLVVNITAPTSMTGFYGFISDSGPILSLVAQRTAGNGYLDLNDAIVGQTSTVPEPGSALLLAPALGALWAIRRRSKRA